MSDSQQNENPPTEGLLDLTLKHYNKARLDVVYDQSLFFTLDPKRRKPTEKQLKARRKALAKKRRRGWRLVYINVEDGWHKREDCDGW